jgi:hypothetical protein
MNLKEKIQTILIEDSGNLQKICFMEDIADEFAIGFAEFTWGKELITINDCGYFEHKFNIYTKKELLEIYKKEKGL